MIALRNLLLAYIVALLVTVMIILATCTVIWALISFTLWDAQNVSGEFIRFMLGMAFIFSLWAVWDDRHTIMLWGTNDND